MNPLRLLPYFMSVIGITCLLPQFWVVSPDRPRSAVPAATHIIKIIETIVLASSLMFSVTNSDIEVTISTERAQRLPAATPK